MLRLGHIQYSNCYPVHAALVDGRPPAWLQLRTGVPSALNQALALGEIDVAPCSSIEFARHPEYRILPGPAIASNGPVRSILLETTVPLEALDGAAVALPTASATSVVLLRALLERRSVVRPRYVWFDQSEGADPIDAGAAAALRIGDVALTRATPRGRRRIDLGDAWTRWTGLPFVYAVWQTRLGPERDEELARLQATLRRSLDFFERQVEGLARERAARFGLEPDVLIDYWSSLRYELGAAEREGLLRFYKLAAELGEAETVSHLRFTPAG
jgi:chorismate dehydratase